MRLTQLAILLLFGHSIANDHRNESRAIHAIRKMSADEGEKFLPDYWAFHDLPISTEPNNTADPNPNKFLRPRTYPLHAPLAHHAEGTNIFARSFQCPTGTTSCASINRASSCCATGSTCQLVQDTGFGDVGCCPAEELCSEVIGGCSRGYTGCSRELGAGCCIPGYECVRGGCASISTVTVTVHSSLMLSTATHTVPAESPGSIVMASTGKTGDLAPPARPTSLSTATTSDTCPVGFYACSAVYQGGCCRTGRNCDTTSCPATSSMTVEGNGHETIVVPAPTATGGEGQCASGWFSCVDTTGGGCCPTGFACGSVSCTATACASAATTVGKEQVESTSIGSNRAGRLGLESRRAVMSAFALAIGVMLMV